VNGKPETDDLPGIAALVLTDNYRRARDAQCWADDISGRIGAGEDNDTCQEPGPFECGLGLCPRHCEEIHGT
jgi:hypothetical protein